MKPRIGVFAYDFPHWKTQQGILNLCAHHLKPEVIMAAPMRKLNIPRSKTRILPKDRHLVTPRRLAYNLHIPYYVLHHNTQETARIIEEYNLDIGIILGARILKPIVINPFRIGVINMHPGVLPDNRGLDNVKWAVIHGIKQGVTTHLVDEEIDRGRLIDCRTINIYHDDTMMDLAIRVQDLEQEMMLGAVKVMTQKNPQELHELPEGHYYNAVPNELDYCLDDFLIEYKKHFATGD